MLKLVIANKNYSSWSMRAWVLMRQAGIDFEEIQLMLGKDTKVIGIERYSAAGKAPVLLIDGASVWDTLAIAETLAERFPQKRLWPEDPAIRRLARSACVEMHSGFQALRGNLPMNIRASLPDRDMNPDVQREIDRILALWRTCRASKKGPGDLLFDHFTIADAFFAPVAMRFTTYGIALPDAAADYVTAIQNLSAVREWCDAARRETAFIGGG